MFPVALNYNISDAILNGDHTKIITANIGLILQRFQTGRFKYEKFRTITDIYVDGPQKPIDCSHGQASNKMIATISKVSKARYLS
jgi:hypothetical protein